MERCHHGRHKPPKKRSNALFYSTTCVITEVFSVFQTLCRQDDGVPILSITAVILESVKYLQPIRPARKVLYDISENRLPELFVFSRKQ